MNLEETEGLKEFERRLEQRLDRGDRSRLRRHRLLLRLGTVAVAAGFVLLLAVVVVALAALLLP